VREAREKGIRACLIRPITLWPFPDEMMHELAARVRAFVVPEMNIGQMVFEVERAAHGQAQVYGLPKVSWELFTPAEILEKIEEVDKWHKTSSSTCDGRTSRTSGAPAADTE